MIPWIQVYSNLPTHRKTAKLADELGLSSSATSPKIVAAGILISLWTWAIQNAYDGDLSECSAETIAEACRWKKSPERLVQSLKSAGFLDDNMTLHDWEEYSQMLIDKEDVRKAQTRERVKRYRERKKDAQEPMTCQYCGEPATGYDHIIPRSKGGTDDDNNLVPCCPWCNSAKQDRDLVDFLNRNLDRVNVDSVTKCKNLSKLVTFDNVTKKFKVTVTRNGYM